MAVTEAEHAALAHALTIARRGPRGRNPQVGAVILDTAGQVIAEGWHRGAGTAHAEVDALAHLDPGQSRGATAVVTLEPCNHIGRTGPCAQALIDAGISRVVYAVDDPGSLEGGGAERLRAAGVDVERDPDATEAYELLQSWLVARRHGRPHITVKWAQSLDGRAAADDGSSRWITGSDARADVHRRRALADAIVVGTGTVLDDDPALTARFDEGLAPHQPHPVAVGQRDVPAAARVRHHPHPLIHHRSHDLDGLVSDLFDAGHHSIFVEGGPTLASAFLRSGLVDEVVVYLAPMLLGGARLALGDLGVTSITDALRLRLGTVERLGDDLVLTLHPDGTVAAETPTPSAAPRSVRKV